MYSKESFDFAFSTVFRCLRLSELSTRVIDWTVSEKLSDYPGFMLSRENSG